jgi:hypothetical protein
MGIIISENKLCDTFTKTAYFIFGAAAVVVIQHDENS